MHRANGSAPPFPDGSLVVPVVGTDATSRFSCGVAQDAIATVTAAARTTRAITFMVHTSRTEVLSAGVPRGRSPGRKRRRLWRSYGSVGQTGAMARRLPVKIRF